MEAKYWMVMGPGGESRVWRMDELATNERRESNEEMTMSSTEEAVRREIEKLEEKVDRLTGARAENRRDGPAFMEPTPYFAENEDETDEETAENEESPDFMPVNTPHN